jgi:ketosteroid isomerase-like protein
MHAARDRQPPSWKGLPTFGKRLIFAFTNDLQGYTKGEVPSGLLRSVAMAGIRKMVLLVTGIGLLLTILLAFVAKRGFATPAQQHDADRAAIQAVLSAQQAAWNRGDIDAFLVGYWHSPELTFSGNSGVSRGWDGVLARYKKNYPDRAAMGELDFSALEFHFLGPDASLVLGKWHLKRQKGDIGGVFTLVWQRFPEGWKIVHDHTSAVTPANP